MRLIVNIISFSFSFFFFGIAGKKKIGVGRKNGMDVVGASFVRTRE